MEEVTHIVQHVLEHSVADTLYLIPFLFITYVAMEWLEHRTAGKTQEAMSSLSIAVAGLMTVVAASIFAMIY